MVNDARRNHVHIEVCHHVGAYYHGTVLFVEGIDHQLQRSLVSIYIVTVQLHGKLAAQGVVHAQVPAPADTQVVTLGNEVNQAVILFIFVDGFGSAVGRMIVDNDQIELEFCFWLSTERMASRMVRMRLRTGIITEASYSKLSALNSIFSNSGFR